MTPQDLLDHAFGLLEGEPLERAVREFEADPELAARRDRLDRTLRLMLDEGPIEPPADLRSRTLDFVKATSAAPRRHVLDFAPRTLPFRLADLAVAAGILLAGVITLLPAMHRARSAVNQAGCMFNLHQLGMGLGQYATAHHVYPSVEPQQYAVSFVVKLKDAGCVDDLGILDCPCPDQCSDSKGVEGCLGEIRNPSPSPKPLHIRCDYAYNVGRRLGDRPAAVEPRFAPSSSIPLVADQPAYSDDGVILAGNSPNHDGRGQNILFHDQSVRWFRVRRIVPQDGDVYLNIENRPSYGLSETDHALIPGAIKVILR